MRFVLIFANTKSIELNVSASGIICDDTNIHISWNCRIVLSLVLLNSLQEFIFILIQIVIYNSFWIVLLFKSPLGEGKE